MKHLISPLVALAFVLSPALASADRAPVKKGSLVGSWKMVSITMNGKTEKVPEGVSVVLRFTPKGTYTVTAKMAQQPERVQSGTYVLSGKTLTVVNERKKKETAKVAFSNKGKNVRITKGNEVALLQRVAARKR